MMGTVVKRVDESSLLTQRFPQGSVNFFHKVFAEQAPGDAGLVG